MSHSTERRRRRFVALATTLAICLGSLAIPAAALADGEIDPSFAAIGYHFGADGAGISLDPVVDRVPTVRVPTVVQSDGKIVIGGRSNDDYMTLVRYNADGSLDTSFGDAATPGFVRQQFEVTPGTATSPPALGSSGAVAMTQDASGNIYVAGMGGGASEFVAQYSPGGTYLASAVCYAPKNLAFTPRSLALRADGSIIIAGAARDRRLDATGTAARTMYGERAVVTLTTPGNNKDGCGARSLGTSLGSDNIAIDGLDRNANVVDSTLSGRWYDGVVALPDNRYVVVSTNGPLGAGTAAWVQRYTAAGAPDTTFNVTGRVSIAGAGLHAAALLGDGTVLAAGELNGQMLLARVTTGGNVTPFTMTAGAGGDTGQAIAVQADGNVIVGGGAQVGSRLAVALVRFTPDGAVDPTFGNGGQTTTLIGTHDAYFTGLALSGTTVAASGRARTTAAPGSLFSIAARYFANGTPTAPVVTPPNGPVGPVVTRVVGTTTVVTAPAVVKTVKQAVKRSCIVPKVKGKLLKKARKALVTRGCRVKVTYAPSTKKAVNIVLAQSRKAGKKLAFRSIVKLMVAKKAHVKVAKKS